MSQLLACAATLAVAFASPVPAPAPASARHRVRNGLAQTGLEPRRSPRMRARQHLLLASAEQPTLSAPEQPGEMAAPPPKGVTGWFVRNRSLLLLIALVVHKCTTDGLTRWTRLQTSYSGATVAVLSEVFKFPLIILAVAALGGGPGQILPVFREAISKPLGNCWIALCYTFNNLLYYDALSTLSAVAYQVSTAPQEGPTPESATLACGAINPLRRVRVDPRSCLRRNGCASSFCRRAHRCSRNPRRCLRRASCTCSLASVFACGKYSPSACSSPAPSS
mgnify:CR=1 FL=1|eukprot:scaffold38524_cov33-Tisochrysis_lutea.AAC.1